MNLLVKPFVAGGIMFISCMYLLHFINFNISNNKGCVAMDNKAGHCVAISECRTVGKI